MTSRKTLRELGLELFSKNYKASQKKGAGMIKCFHITVTEVREGSCFCDVPAALYSVFKNCYEYDRYAFTECICWYRDIKSNVI